MSLGSTIGRRAHEKDDYRARQLFYVVGYTPCFCRTAAPAAVSLFLSRVSFDRLRFALRVRSIEDRTMRPGVSFVRALLEGWKPAGGVDPSPRQHVSRGVIQQRR